MCGKGIHYYKSIKAAFCFCQNPLINHTEHWYIWNQDGSAEAKYEYFNGKRNSEVELFNNCGFDQDAIKVKYMVITRTINSLAYGQYTRMM